MIEIVTRNAAGLMPPLRRYTSPDPSEGVVVHCTAGRVPKSRKDALAAWRAAQAWHQRGLGWRDIGYAWGFNDFGMVLEGRGWDAVGSHAKGHNRRFRGVVYQGKGLRPTEEAIEALAWLIDRHDEIYGPGLVFGHRDISSKTCPGDGVYEALCARWGERNPYRGPG